MDILGRPMPPRLPPVATGVGRSMTVGTIGTGQYLSSKLWSYTEGRTIFSKIKISARSHQPGQRISCERAQAQVSSQYIVIKLETSTPLARSNYSKVRRA